MAEVSIRELRNHGGDVVDRVEAGETVTVTRSGRPVAVLGPLPRRGTDAATLLDRWRRIPKVDPERFRRDVDEVMDQTL